MLPSHAPLHETLFTVVMETAKSVTVVIVTGTITEQLLESVTVTV